MTQDILFKKSPRSLSENKRMGPLFLGQSYGGCVLMMNAAVQPFHSGRTRGQAWPLEMAVACTYSALSAC
jgi:hypothetical protein